jgi:LmbE family N-acetylglucosaminyl deacetylase
MQRDPLLLRFCAARGSGDWPTALVIAAHPDDETIGAGARLAAMGGTCSIIHLTDGAPADRRYFPEVAKNWTRAEYARRRRAEARNALAIAGIGEERARWLGLRDQEIPFEMASAAETVAEAICMRPPELIVTHAYEGGHPDHDGAALVVHAAVALARARGVAPIALAEMTGYHDRSGMTVRGEFLPGATGGPEITLELTDDERRVKRSMFAAYVTQQAVLAQFRGTAERFRTAPAYDFLAPPHAGRLHYERFGLGMGGAMWRALARSALKKLALGGSKL